MEIKELLKSILQALMDNPQNLEIKEINTSFYTILEVHVPKEERAFIIGKNGKTINAIRQIVSIAAAQQKKYVLISVVD